MMVIIGDDNGDDEIGDAGCVVIIIIMRFSYTIQKSR